jgi:ATP-dependent Clp protease ATP-binding subunit ClpC
VFERFTAGAKQSLVLAQESARALHHRQIGPEHLLLGVLHAGPSPAHSALTATGVIVDGLRARLRPGGKAVAGHIPFTDEAKKSLEGALHEALNLGHNYIGSAHLVLGMLRLGPKTLQPLGIDALALRDRMLSELAANPTADCETLPPELTALVKELERPGPGQG